MAMSSAALHYHREAHSARGANSHQAELLTAAPQFVQQGRRDSRTGCAEWMADCDRASHDVQPRLIHLADRTAEPRTLGPVLRLESAEIRENLRGERLVHLDEINVAKREARTVKSDRGSENWCLEKLLTRIECRIRIRSDVTEWLVAERFGFLLTHQEHACGAVGERRRVPCCHGTVLSIENRLQRGELLEARVGSDSVVGSDHALVFRRNVNGDDLGGQAPVGSSSGGEAMRPERELILLFTHDVVELRHL